MGVLRKRIFIAILTVFALLIAVGIFGCLYFGGFDELSAAVDLKLMGIMPLFMLPQPQGVPVLMYHHLAPEGTYTGTVNEYNAAIISCEAFAEQMEYLHNEGYSTVFLSELVDMLINNKTLPAKTVAICFDDAYESVYRYAFPILQEYGFKADIAIIGISIDKPAQGEYKPAELSSLGQEQIAEMRDSGLIEFQTHTYGLHQILPIDSYGNESFSATARIYLPHELRPESGEEHESRIKHDFVMQRVKLADYGISSDILLYPYGACDRELIKLAKSEGIRAAFTVDTGIVTADSDIYRLPRLTIGPQDTIESFTRKLTYGK